MGSTIPKGAPAIPKGATAEAASAPDAPARPEPRPDGTIVWVLGTAAVVGVLLSVGTLLVYDARFALGVAIGAALAVANLAVLGWVARAILRGGRQRRMGGLVGIAKLLALFGGIWLLWSHGVASPLALVVGYGALPIGIAVGGMLAPRPDEHPGRTVK
jgi:hypothetical protein